MGCIYIGYIDRLITPKIIKTSLKEKMLHSSLCKLSVVVTTSNGSSQLEADLLRGEELNFLRCPEQHIGADMHFKRSTNQLKMMGRDHRIVRQRGIQCP